MDLIDGAVLATYATVVLAGFRRNRTFGVFAAIILGFPTFIGLALRSHLPWGEALVPYFQLAAIAHFGLLLVRPQMRGGWFRALVSIPGLWFVAAALLALPWAITAALGFEPMFAWIPFAICIGGVVQSLWTREETVDVRLEPQVVDALRRYPEGHRITDAAARPLKVVQITDPHLGPFMSVERLRRICERAVEREPDLILITGDLMTMESHDVSIVIEALAPLAAAKGKVFACHGNHDHEARLVVATAYETLGIELLNDEATTVSTPAGNVQIVGLDFVWRGRAEHIRSVCERYPREEGAMRLLLLHDPGAFKHVPDGEADLVLSGHTHGGQVGLLSLGLPTTFLSLFTKIPDHGLWALGRNRMYVHRAQGLYGYPIRLGVPAEQSLMQVHPH